MKGHEFVEQEDLSSLFPSRSTRYRAVTNDIYREKPHDLEEIHKDVPHERLASIVAEALAAFECP